MPSLLNATNFIERDAIDTLSRRVDRRRGGWLKEGRKVERYASEFRLHLRNCIIFHVCTRFFIELVPRLFNFLGDPSERGRPV